MPAPLQLQPQHHIGLQQHMEQEHC
jgi:hypothetical protein